jgi:hypothetical protein
VTPLWSILIPTIGQRERLLLRLLDVLMPQVDAVDGAVRVLAWRNNGSPHIGEIRDLLLHDAGTEYVSFIDDDDLVPEYYVTEVLRALESRPDHVGFQLEYSTDGAGHEIVDHSLRHHRWHRGYDGMLRRDFTHIDPIRRDLAMRGTFRCRPGRAEDRYWVKQVRPHLSTEAYIDKIMYHYLWRRDTSAWQNPAAIVPKAGRPQIESPYFSWHPRSDP